jgi:hypothetical protein
MTEDEHLQIFWAYKNGDGELPGQYALAEILVEWGITEKQFYEENSSRMIGTLLEGRKYRGKGEKARRDAQESEAKKAKK